MSLPVRIMQVTCPAAVVFRIFTLPLTRSHDNPVRLLSAIEKKQPVNKEEEKAFDIMKCCIGWVLGKFENIPGVAESQKATKKKVEEKKADEKK